MRELSIFTIFCLLITVSSVYAAPPAKLWGNVSTIVRKTETNTGLNDGTSQVFSTLTLGISSYIWQPWFAMYSGILGFTNDKTRYESAGSSSSDFLIGNLNLTLFPSSRFPAYVYAEKNQNNNDLRDVEANVKTSRYGFRQQYREPAGMYQFDFLVEHDERVSNTDGTSRGDLARLQYSQSWAGQRLEINTEGHQQNNRVLQTRAKDASIIVRHSLQRVRGLSVESLGSVIQVDDRFRDISRNIEAIQLSSFATWRPEKVEGLLITGSARISDLENSNKDEFASDTNNVKSTSANFSANYNITESVTIKGGANLINTSNAGSETSFTSRSLGLSYQPGDTPLGAFRYNRGVSVAVVDRSAGDDSEQRYLTRFSHRVNGDFEFGISDLFVSFDQSFSQLNSTIESKSNQMTHAINGNWRFGKQNDNSLIRVQLSDTRFYGRDEAIFQLFNVQYTKDRAISRDSLLTGNFTIQVSRQEAAGDTTMDVIANGVLGYRKRYLFNIPRFRMDIELEVISHGLTPDEFSPVRRDTAAAEQGRFRTRFVYSLGKMDVSLTTLVTSLDGDLEKTIQLQLSRGLGAQ